MENKDLKSKYDEMHKKGPSAWFGQGEEERELILKMGEPWENKIVLEIGCGEGDLLFKLYCKGSRTIGIDYSLEALKRAKDKYPNLNLQLGSYRTFTMKSDRLVLQGVLEHLDNPFTELKWMMDNLLSEKGDVITSSPCFLNPRGIVWMTLDMLGAVMSKTDLHFLNPWDFEGFCKRNNYQMSTGYCDIDWGMGNQMIEDFIDRIPKALKDGNLPYNSDKFDKFLIWLKTMARYPLSYGATAVYKISK